MADVFDTLLLLALPASGKSEVRRYLESLPAERCEREFHIGGAVQLDDFPYVHFMRLVDEGLLAQGRPRIYFVADDKSFADPRDWGTLVNLVNEDYDNLVAHRVDSPALPGLHILDRLERAAIGIGIEPRLSLLDDNVRGRLAADLAEEAAAHLETLRANQPESLKGKTVVIEFARGGAAGAPMPLAPPMGYQHSLGLLNPAILATACILYIWVTPEESRRKNSARADPDDPGSILNHGVPIDVMMNDYGCDDIEHLLTHSEQSNTVQIKLGRHSFYLPLARFDNRVDKTSFIRDAPSRWSTRDVNALDEGLLSTCQQLWRTYRLEG